MAGVNKVILLGNLGSDPETRYTQAGETVTNFSLATSEKWKGKDGEQREKTEWHKIVTWRKVAEACRDYLSKGSQVYVEGKIVTEQWEDKEGNKRYTTKIDAQYVKFLDSKPKQESQHYPSHQEEDDGSPAYDGPPPISDDDVPFG